MFKSDFYSGAISVIAIYSLWQDVLGKENYIKMVESIWIPWYITVPLACILVVFAIIIREDSK
jgi:hypothetical protein